MGPTAVGKTSLSIKLAKLFNGEIINGDSLQVYRELDIGTAKVTEEEMAGVPHHLIDVVDVNEPYTASDFKEAAEKTIEAIQLKGKTPILVGGSGLYIQGILQDMQFGRTGEDLVFRAQLEAEQIEKGSEAIWKKLQEIDPEAAAAIHVNNTRRVIRALESIHVSGEKFSTQKMTGAAERYDALLIALNCERSLLYDRINERVEHMVDAGILDEARMLHDLATKADNQAHKGIGYKEWFPYFDGDISLDEAKEMVKQNSRRYAKRQLTWFRNRMSNVHWFDVLNPNFESDVLNLVSDFIKNRNT